MVWLWYNAAPDGMLQRFPQSVNPWYERENLVNPAAESQLRRRLRSRTIHPPPFIVLLCDSEIGKFRRHDAPWRRTRYERILREVLNAFVLSQEVLVQHAATVHIFRWSSQDSEYSVGEDGRLAQIRAVCLRTLCRRRIDGLQDA